MPFINAFGGKFGKIMQDHHGGQHVGELSHGGSHPGTRNGADVTSSSSRSDVTSSKPAPSRNLAAEARAAAQSFNYEGARQAVLRAAEQGRATLLPAGSRNNATARVLIDGEDVGQASSLTHLVHEATGQESGPYANAGAGGTKFQERRLLPGDR
jgi:hypothetical protein